MSQPESAEAQVGRPRKYKDESTESLTTRVPTSVIRHLTARGPTRHIAAADVLVFERELTEQLEEVRMELLISAAHQGKEYSADRAETIARLVKLGLAAEKAGQDKKKR